MHICLALKKIIAFTTFSWVGKLLPCTVSGPGMHSDPHPPVGISYLVQILYSTPSLTISCLDNPHSLPHCSPSPRSPPSVHSSNMQSKQDTIFSIVKMFNFLITSRMIYKSQAGTVSGGPVLKTSCFHCSDTSSPLLRGPTSAFTWWG